MTFGRLDVSRHDRIVGDGGNVTVYQRPDGSYYSLDRSSLDMSDGLSSSVERERNQNVVSGDARASRFARRAPPDTDTE
jgi:hypothetical protein